MQEQRGSLGGEAGVAVVDIEADTAAGLSLILLFHLAKVLKDANGGGPCVSCRLVVERRVEIGARQIGVRGLG